MSGKELSLPEGLSQQKIEAVIKKRYSDAVILKLLINPGSTAGDNNLSVITRLVVKFSTKLTQDKNNQDKEESYIIKDTNIAAGDFLSNVCGTEKEMSWYVSILPQFEKLGVEIGAKCYEKTDKWLLLEDLRSSGYKVCDRKALLDLDHSLAAVKSLARFHAATHHLYESHKIPDIALKNTLFQEGQEGEIYRSFKMFDTIVESLEEMGEKSFTDSIKSLKSTAWKNMMNCVNGYNDFLCLAHGDYWTTNILFRYNGDKVSNAKIIDFQLIRLSNPAYDLHFFVVTSVKEEVRDQHLHQIFDTYYQTLDTTLQQINSKTRLSRTRFDQIMEETRFMALFTALTFLPVPMCETPLLLEPPANLTEEEKKDYIGFEPVYQQQTYRKHLVSLLKFFRRNKVI